MNSKNELGELFNPDDSTEEQSTELAESIEHFKTHFEDANL